MNDHPLEKRRNVWLKRAHTQLKALIVKLGVHYPSQPLLIRVGAPMPDDGSWDGMFYPATPIFPTHVCINRDIGNGEADVSHHILGVLLHEMCHFATESECRAHGNRFRAMAISIGLRTAKGEVAAWTTPTPSLHRELERIVRSIGTYPVNVQPTTPKG